MPEAARCFGCGAPLPTTAEQEIVSCGYCGSESNVRTGKEVPWDLPTARYEKRPDPYHDPEREVELYDLTHKPDVRLAARIAGEGFGEDDLVWLPLIVERLKESDGKLAELFSTILYKMGRLYATRVWRQLIGLARQNPELPGLVRALGPVGAGALKLLLDIGSEDAIAAATESVERESRDYAVVLSILAYRIFHVPRPIQEWICGVITKKLHEVYVHRGPDFLRPLFFRLLDDCVHDAPELIPLLTDPVVKNHVSWYKCDGDLESWVKAMAFIPSREGMKAAHEFFYRLYNREDPGACTVPDNLDSLFKGLPETPEHSAEGKPSVSAGKSVADRAGCPNCGTTLSLEGADEKVTCPSCTTEIRMPRRLRAFEPNVKEKTQDEYETWTPGQLVKALLEDPDPKIRMAIAEEMTSPDRNGRNFIPHIPDIVNRMMLDDDEWMDSNKNIALPLQTALQQFLRTGGREFREAFIESCADLVKATQGSSRLMQFLGELGPPSIGLLLDIAGSALKEWDIPPQELAARAADMANIPVFGLSALQGVSEALHRAEPKFLFEAIEGVLPSLSTTNLVVQGQLSGSIGSVFTRGPGVNASLEKVLLHFDGVIDPANSQWFDWGKDPQTLISAMPFTSSGTNYSVDQTIASISSCWEEPETWKDLKFRLDLLERFQTHEMRIITLIPLLRGLPDMTADQKKEFKAALEPWKNEKNLTLAVTGLLKRV